MLSRSALVVSRRGVRRTSALKRNNAYGKALAESKKVLVQVMLNNGFHTATALFAKAGGGSKKSDPKAFSVDEVEMDADMDLDTPEVVEAEEEVEMTVVESTALLRMEINLSLPQFIALFSKTISTLSPEDSKLANKIRHLLGVSRPLVETMANREKTVAETLRSANPLLKEWSDTDLYDEVQVRVKHYNTLLDALPTRDIDRTAIRSLIESEDGFSLRKFMELDLGLGGRSRILRPVLYESKPIDITPEELYFDSDLPVDQIFSAKNLGRYVRLSDRDLAKFFPEAMGGKIISHEFESTKVKGLLIRKPVLEAIELLKKAEAGAFVQSNGVAPTVFHGEKGSGKSAALAQVVYWARRSGWIVLYLPDGYQITAAGEFIEKSPLRKDTSIWDDPANANKILNFFLTAHAEKLKEIPLKTKFTLGKLQGQTLFDLVEYGAALPQFSAAAFHHLRNELARVTEFPVLLACDDYSMFYDYSRNFADPESTRYRKDPLPARKLAIVDAVYDGHLNPRLAYGTFIGATTETHSTKPFNNSQPEEVRKNWLHVPGYSREEFDRVVSHYRFSNWVRSELPVNTREYVFQLTSGVGADLWKYSQKL